MALMSFSSHLQLRSPFWQRQLTTRERNEGITEFQRKVPLPSPGVKILVVVPYSLSLPYTHTRTQHLPSRYLPSPPFLSFLAEERSLLLLLLLSFCAKSLLNKEN